MEKEKKSENCLLPMQTRPGPGKWNGFPESSFTIGKIAPIVTQTVLREKFGEVAKSRNVLFYQHQSSTYENGHELMMS